MSELAALHRAILALAATGKDGFEGFVADMLAEITGQQFRLMKAGPQGGFDAAGRSATGFTIAVEGKQYGSRSKLPLDQLKSKLRDASESIPELDLWILAATRSVSHGDVAALEKVGTGLGIDVLVLDWIDKTMDPPALAVLCAKAPTAVQRHLPSTPAIGNAIAWVRNHARFDAASTCLVARLLSAEVGYGAARSAMATWLRSRMEHEDSAWLAFNSRRAALLHPEAHRISRSDVTRALDAWWDHERGKLHVVQADEGHGKTWAALGWWLSKQATDPLFPLTVIVPAKHVDVAQPETIVARELQAALGTRDDQFWARRLRRWLEGPASAARVFIIVDGLNQNWTFSDWQELFVSTLAAERHGKLAMLVTTRPDHARTTLKGLHVLGIETVDFLLPRFSQDEVAEVIKSYGLRPDEFSRPLLELLRIPRLCHGAVRRKRELEASGDITPERVIYEDWRDRQPEAQRRMTNEEFREFLSRVAREISMDPQAGLSRRRFLEELTLQSGEPAQEYRSVLSEVIDGGWLESTGKPNMFRVRPDKLPYALGLALVDELRCVQDVHQARTALHRALDVHQETDFGVRILRCAASLAMTEDVVVEPVRRVILSAWLDSQNFRNDDFDTFWKNLGGCPGTVLDIAEEAWFGRSRRSGQDDIVLFKAIANASQWKTVLMACEDRLTTWFSGYWEDPYIGEIIDDLLDDERAHARRSLTRERAIEWTSASEGSDLFGLSVVAVEPTGRAFGCFRAIELMSWLPRQPMLRAITAWAITRSIMGPPRQQVKFSWLLRWNEHDAESLEPALMERISELSDLGTVGLAAAQALLEALATPAAEKRRESLIAPEGTSSGTAETESPELHPECSEPGDLGVRAARIDDDTIRRALLGEPSFAHAALLKDLTRWQPHALRQHARRQIAIILAQLEVVPYPAVEANAMLPWLVRLHLLLTPDDIARWKDVASRVRTAGGDWDWNLQVGALLGEPTCAQIELLDSSPKDLDLESVERRLNPLDSDSAAAVDERLDPSHPEEDLVFWLGYVSHAQARTNGPLICRQIAPLLAHASTKVREHALRAALLDESTEHADALAATPWSWRTASSRQERVLGSLLLAKAGGAEDGSLVGRVHPEVLGHLVDRFPDQDVYLTPFAEHVRVELLELRTATSRSFPHALMNQHRGWDELTNSRPADLEQWLSPFLEDGSRRLMGLWHENFPLIEAIKAIAPRRPKFAADLFMKLFEDETANGFHSGSLHSIGIRLDFDEAECVRQHVLQRANNDSKLFDLVLGLYRSDQDSWLHHQIETDLQSDMSGRIARGFTLAGFLLPGEFGDDFWGSVPRSLPRSGWLREVARVARGRYQQARDCLHAFDRFNSVMSDEEAYECFELFQQLIDPRLFVLLTRKGEKLAAWPDTRAMHWSLNSNLLKARCGEVEESLKKTFLCSEPPMFNQAPARW